MISDPVGEWKNPSQLVYGDALSANRTKGSTNKKLDRKISPSYSYSRFVIGKLTLTRCVIRISMPRSEHADQCPLIFHIQCGMESIWRIEYCELEVTSNISGVAIPLFILLRTTRTKGPMCWQSRSILYISASELMGLVDALYSNMWGFSVSTPARDIINDNYVRVMTTQSQLPVRWY